MCVNCFFFFRFLGEDVYVYLYGDDIDELVININMLRLSLLDEDDLQEVVNVGKLIYNLFVFFEVILFDYFY